jgi:hypothetical protein
LREINVADENTAYCSIDGVLYTKDETTLVQYPVGKQNSELVLSDKVTTIEVGALSRAVHMQRIIVSDTHPLFKSVDGVLYSKDGKTLLQYPAGKGDTDIFVVPDGVTEIAMYAFNGNVYLPAIRFNQVTKVGEGAFANCTDLVSVIIPATVMEMGAVVFGGCTRLTIVYCEIAEQPESWVMWDFGAENLTVHWGYTVE